MNFHLGIFLLVTCNSAKLFPEAEFFHIWYFSSVAAVCYFRSWRKNTCFLGECGMCVGDGQREESFSQCNKLS